MLWLSGDGGARFIGCKTLGMREDGRGREGGSAIYMIGLRVGGCPIRVRLGTSGV